MENYRQGLELICSQESYDELLNSGFSVIRRDESRTLEETLALVDLLYAVMSKLPAS